MREQWRETLAELPPETTVVLNADDPSVSTLARDARGPVLQFGIDDAAVAEPPDAAQRSLDALWDEESGADYVYERRYLAHLGLWACPGAAGDGPARPEPGVVAREIDLDAPVGLAFSLRSGDEERRVQAPLRGLYNVYNALAAAAAATALGLPGAEVAGGLAGAAAAFGRQEELLVEGHAVRILLGKNPAGVNAALRTLTPGGPQHLLVLLNDGLADGTDVSWIWDTDWEVLRDAASLVVGGRRAADMALRLCYAGFPEPLAVERSIEAALRARLDALPPGEPLVVLPTYTALLDVREQLGRMAGARRIWEGA